jgi:hypothetical protein
MIQIVRTLYRTYYNRALINIPVNYDLQFGAHDRLIDIYFGEWNINHVIAKIDRNANNNHPRIRSVGFNGILWRNWMQANHNIGDNILVSFDNPIYPGSILIQ